MAEYAIALLATLDYEMLNIVKNCSTQFPNMYGDEKKYALSWAAVKSLTAAEETSQKIDYFPSSSCNSFSVQLL